MSPEGMAIHDWTLFKNGQVNRDGWTRRFEDRELRDVDVSGLLTIEVGDRYTPGSVKLEVGKFVPVEGDALYRSWVAPGGLNKSVPVPPYAIADSSAAKRAYTEYIENVGVEFPRKILNDELLRRIYEMAIAVSDDPNTVSSPLENL